MNEQPSKTTIVGTDNEAPIYLGRVVNIGSERGEIVCMREDGLAEVQLDNGELVILKRHEWDSL